MKRHGLLIACFVSFVIAFPASAQPRIDPAGIDGALLLAGSHDIAPATFEKFVELAGGAKAKIVILKLAPANPPTHIKLQDGLAVAAKKLDAAEPRVVEIQTAKKDMAEATGVWLQADSPGSWDEALKITGECQALLQRGGILGVSDSLISMLGSHSRYSSAKAASMALLPDALIDWTRARGGLLRPLGQLKQLRGIVGYQVDRNATMLVKGRTVSVIGDGAVHIHVGPREITLTGKQREDLTALRRAARDLAESFPPKNLEPPFVEKGTLVIVGGGGSPAGLNQKFVELAGGEGKACIVIFPTAAEDPLPKREVLAAAFKKAGAKKATVLYGKTRTEVESKEFLDTLKEATGLWFDGGRQWRFVDCYENTKALPAMFDVLSRGGVIGGTSAGATIQGDYLCRGGVFNNFDIRYEGYERGLGFLKGVAIDQHFTKRNRQPEMTKLMKTYPQYLGIGLDEATAIVVKGQVADVIGNGKVHFYDANRKLADGQPDFEALAAGARYDLKERKVVAVPK
jgi:cyanophycinase